MVPGAAFNVGEEDSGKSGREAERAQGTVTTGLEVRAEGRMCGSSMLAFNLLLLSNDHHFLFSAFPKSTVFKNYPSAGDCPHS